MVFILSLLLFSFNTFLLTNESKGAVELTSENFHSIVGKYKLALVNFRVRWCPFSQTLDPIFDEASDIILNESISILMGKVDCEKNLDLSNSFRVTKFPTILLLKDGNFSGREYNSERTTAALVKFVKSFYYIGPKNITEDDLSEEKGPAVILKIDSPGNPFYPLYFKLGYEYSIDCKFYSIFGHPSGSTTSVSFVSPTSGTQSYSGDLFSDSLPTWINDVCRPFVREIEFSNAEEISASSNALLILFYNPLNGSVKEQFRNIAEKHKNLLNGILRPVTANSNVFKHALYHIGKTSSDAPLLVIDNFRHMFLFPDYNEVEDDAKLIQFVDDFKSEKLHKDFHDRENHNVIYINFENKALNNKNEDPKIKIDIPKERVHQPGENNPEITPSGYSIFKSIFNKLAPNERRYTLLNYDDL